MMSWCWTMRVNSALRVTQPSQSPPLLSSPQAPGLASCFFRSHMGGRFELDRELNHITAAWMSWLRTDAQTVGYQIRTQGLFFHLLLPSLFVYHHLFLFSQSLVLFCSFSPSLVGDRVTQVSRLRIRCGGLFRQPGKCSISAFFYFI